MLKTLLACLLASLVAAPTFTDNAVRVGMTRKQVEAILGPPLCWGGFHSGVNSSAGIECSDSMYEGLTVYFVGEVVSSVGYHR